MPTRLPLQSWTLEQIEQGREWVAAWKRAGPELERIRREELPAVYRAISLLLGPVDYTIEPRAPGRLHDQRFVSRPAMALIAARPGGRDR